VEARIEIALALQRTLTPAPAPPAPREPSEAEPRLNIEVIFTSIEATLAALKQAAELASRLAARITLVVPQVVPRPLQLESPPVLIDWNERRFRVVAKRSSVETTVQIYLCRDRIQTLCAVLRPHSIVVIGSPKRWWPTWEGNLSRVLRRAGHEVIVVQTE
jgi:hypothetical protein